MPAIIHREMSSRNLGDFIDTVKTDKKLFLALGRRVTAWSGGPDQIANTPEEKTNFWDELLGVKKLAVKDIIPMVPEREWTTGLPYVVFDETKEQAFDDAFYVVTSKYEVFTVAVAGGGNSTVMPEKATAGTSLADGYTWTYQFTVNKYEYQQTPAGWMSVNYGDSVDASDTAQNLDAFITLGSRYLLVRIEIKDPDTSGEFTAGDFRQVALISHPRLDADDSLVINTYEPVANLKMYSGFMVYLENREPESIISGQNTDLKITLRF